MDDHDDATLARLAALEAVAEAFGEFVQWYDVGDGERRDGLDGFVRRNAYDRASEALGRGRAALARLRALDATEGGEA